VQFVACSKASLGLGWSKYPMTDETIPPAPKKRGPKVGVHGATSGAFKKGHDPRRAVGNNMARAKDGKSVASIARGYTEEALLKQVEIMRDPDAPVREVLRASELIIARGWGTATQTVDISASIKHQHEVSTIDFTAISQEARIQLLSAVKLLPPDDFDQVEDAEYTIAPPRETDASDD